MSEKGEEWYRRSTEAVNYREKLKLVDEVLSSDEAPEFLKNVARQTMRNLKTYIEGGMVDPTDKHRADHSFASLKIEFGNVK